MTSSGSDVVEVMLRRRRLLVAVVVVCTAVGVTLLLKFLGA